MRRKFVEMLSIDPRSLAVFRIALAAILLVDLSIRSTALAAHYTDAGAAPRDAMRQFFGVVWQPSLHMLGGSVEFQAALFAAAAIAAVSMLVGFRTRVATIVSWLLLCSLHLRNPVVINGGDILLRAYLFWAIFLPTDRVWSLDARRKKTGGSLTAVFNVATVCALLQVCIVYLCTAYAKWNEHWLDGLGLYYAFSYDSFARPLAYVLAGYPDAMRLASYATLALEWLGPFLLFVPVWTKPIRLLVIASFLALHLGIELTLTVGVFSYASMAGWLLFVPDTAWNWLSRRFGRTSQSPVPPPTDEPIVTRRTVGTRVAGGICILAMIYILTVNVANVTRSPAVRAALMPAWMARIDQATLLGQNWALFHIPVKQDQWYLAKAKLKNGDELDLVTGQPVSWEWPDSLIARHPSQRWRKFYRLLYYNDYKPFRETLCRYLAETWNARHGEEEQVMRVDLYYIQKTVPPPGEPVRRTTILLHSCILESEGAFLDAVRESSQEDGGLGPGI